MATQFPSQSQMDEVFSSDGRWAGAGYFVGDEISGDDIIGPEYLSFDLEQADERKMLAAYAFAGLAELHGRFCEAGACFSPYQVVIAGERFGKGSGRLHSAVGLNEAGIRIILARSYGEDFYRTCVNTGSILPLIFRLDEEVDWEVCKAGMRVEIDVVTQKVQVLEAGQESRVVARGAFEDPGVVLDIGVAGGLQWISGRSEGC